MSSSSLRSSCRFISFDEIRHEDGSVPFDFDKGKILGKGGEATVYLACLYTGQKKTLIAVKRLTYNATHEFESEIQTMSKIHHSNTVSLLGYCGQSGQKILIYEYMEKGNLTDYIIPKAGSIILSWKQRLNICLGAARGLQYLHTKTVEFPKGIIHRDIKPDNILINENWVGKIADFGMVKLSHADQVKSTMITNIKGTMGFYAPEYLSLGTVSRKIDVYAFGVVLFYVLCLKSPWNRGAESYYRREDEDLGLYAQQCIDTRIKEEISHDSLKVYTDTIQGSLQVDPKLRPDMDTVVLKLEKALECQNLQDEALKCQNLQDEAKRGTSLKSPWNRGAESYYRREDEDLGLYARQCIDTRIKEEISHDSLKVYTDTIQGSLQVDPELPPYMDTVELKLLKELECQNLQDEALKCQNLQDEAKQGTSFRFDDIMKEKSRLWSVKYGGRRPSRST